MKNWVQKGEGRDAQIEAISPCGYVTNPRGSMYTTIRELGPKKPYYRRKCGSQFSNGCICGPSGNPMKLEPRAKLRESVSTKSTTQRRENDSSNCRKSLNPCISCSTLTLAIQYPKSMVSSRCEVIVAAKSTVWNFNVEAPEEAMKPHTYTSTSP